MYEFKEIDEDTTQLTYKDKKFDFKRTVGLVEKLQKVNNRAKIKMMNSLKEQGMTSNDLIVKTTKDGKLYEDKTNLVDLEEYFVGLESMAIYDEICKEFTGMTYAGLIVDIGLDADNQEQVKEFTVQLSRAIMKPSETPR